MNEESVLQRAIDKEESAQGLYLDACKLSRDPQIRQLYLRLASEEASHAAGLRVLLKALGRRPPSPTLEQWDDSWQSSGREAVEYDESAGELAIMEKAIASERVSIALYRRAHANASSRQAKGLYESLWSQEEDHLSLLLGELEALKRGNGET